jgi:hypothetical protein
VPGARFLVAVAVLGLSCIALGVGIDRARPDDAGDALFLGGLGLLIADWLAFMVIEIRTEGILRRFVANGRRAKLLLAIGLVGAASVAAGIALDTAGAWKNGMPVNSSVVESNGTYFVRPRGVLGLREITAEEARSRARYDDASGLLLGVGALAVTIDIMAINVGIRRGCLRLARERV